MTNNQQHNDAPTREKGQQFMQSTHASQSAAAAPDTAMPDDVDLSDLAKFWQQQPFAMDTTPISGAHDSNAAATVSTATTAKTPSSTEADQTSADFAAQTTLRQAQQKQRQQRWWLVLDIAGAVVMLLMMAWLLMTQQGVIGYSAAALLSLGVLGSLYSIWHIHVPVLAYAQWNSIGILQFRYRRALLTIRYNRVNQIAALLLALFAAGLWLYQHFQPQQLPSLLVHIYLLGGLPLAAAIYLRCAQRIKAQQAKLPHLRQLLADFAEHEPL